MDNKVERFNEGSEQSYTITNVLTLVIVIIVLSFTGICMCDIIRYMWSCGELYAINSLIIDWILDIFGDGKVKL